MGNSAGNSVLEVFIPDEDQNDAQEIPGQRVRAKFVVQKVDEWTTGGGRVILTPVMGDSEENKRFFQATPNGTIEQ